MNSEKYQDPTAEQAIAHVVKAQKQTQEAHAMRTIKTLQTVAHIAGFEVVNHIELLDKQTGRLWK